MKKFNLLTYIILLATLGAIVGLFYTSGLFEKNGLFYFNLGLACFVGLLFFCTKFISSQERYYTVQSFAVTRQIFLYCSVITVLMLVFNFALINIHAIKPLWYIISVCSLSLFYLVRIFNVWQAMASVAKIEKLRSDNSVVIKEFPKIQEQFSEAIVGKKIDILLQEKAKKSIRTLYETVTFVPVDLYTKNPDLGNNVIQRFNELCNKINEISQLENEEALKKQLETIDASARNICQQFRQN